MLHQVIALLTFKLAASSKAIVQDSVDGSTVQHFEPEHVDGPSIPSSVGMFSLGRSSVGSSDVNSSAIGEVDAKGRQCSICGPPVPDRAPPNKTYALRSDCGNHSVSVDPLAFTEPLIGFKRDGNSTHNWTNAWCELNMQVACVNGLWNKDALYQARVVDYPRNLIYDPYYCFYNGWLSPELRYLQNNFTAMTTAAEKECQRPVRAQHNWNTTMTQLDMFARYKPNVPPYHPTREDALFIGSWNCAMGTPLCDMAYCAYSFCVKAEHGDGTVDFGMYEECDDWDPVEGMPVAWDLGTPKYSRHE